LIHRLPLGISLFNPKRSFCPICNQRIQWYENIPVLSFLFLKGKCSNCHNKISFIYPLVEILTACITVVLYLKLGLTQELCFMLLIFYILILLSFIDFEYKAVPDYLLILLVLATLTYLFLYKIGNVRDFFLFAGGIFMIEFFVTYYIQNIKSYLLKDDSLKDQRAMGEGDIPVIAIIGGLLGVQFGLIAIFLSAIFAIIPSIVNIVFKKEIETAFIPYLSLGFFIAYIFEQNLQRILEGLNIV
ncbi:MAG: leader peptidase (prepilin peptidase)/N-methyltransferase, partial [Arcobacteraceae bacterium]